MITLQNISFQYDGTNHGVWDIDLTISKGECVVLTGCSGNGKTTLTRIVNGLAPKYYPGAFSGQLCIAGEDIACQPLWLRGKTVGSIFQDPSSQFFSSELAGEVAFACENYGLEHHIIVERTNNAIKTFGLEDLRKRSLDTLSSGEKQRTAIASVYALGPSVYVCDEPTANLDEEGINSLADILKDLKADGNTILIAEHRLNWLRGIADRFVHIENGRIVWQRTPTEMAKMTKDEQIEFGLRSFVPVSRVDLPLPTGEGRPIISAKSLSCKRRKNLIWQGIDFECREGQVVAIIGENGVGKTTFAKVISGLIRQNSGSVTVYGKELAPGGRRKNVWYSDNDTGTQFFTNSVTEELLLCTQRTDETLERARTLLKELELYSYKDAHPAALSGGQKQRLSFACGILSDRPVMIFDEPTSGLDGRNLRLVGKMLRQIARQGKCVLVITHDNELIDECCTHSYVISSA